ncbi:MAG: RNA-binding protein [Candidatus Margulisbacteria bacterium]|jgi:RNA recognition motif-containing protein|nr:RNA-binding protein [Candidatus Margulisiibacteriota bacterium]
MNLYIGNLSYEVEEDDLREAFQPFGEIKSVKVIKDRETGRSKGFGFVEVERGEDAIQALNGQSIKGREVRINEARPK